MPRLLSLSALILLTACGPSDDDFARAQDTSDALRAAAEAHDRAFRAGAQAALQEPASGRCDASVLVRDDTGAPQNYSEHQLAELDEARLTHSDAIIHELDGKRRYLSQEIEIDSDSLADIELQFDRLRREQLATEHEVVFIARSVRDPELEGALFRPGLIEGRILVWDVGAERVLCSADVSVRSRAQVSVTAGAEAWSLKEDLVYDTRARAFEALGLGEIDGSSLGAAHL